MRLAPPKLAPGPILRHPLVHFLSIGAVLFAVHGWVAPTPPGRRIDIGAELRDRVAADLVRRGGPPPTEAELEAALRNYVEGEVMYREALALGLDRGDVIIRRRLIQKMGMVLEEREPPPEPSEDELERWRTEHAASYAATPRVSLTQVFVSRERLGRDPEAPIRLLASLRAGAAPRTLGDPFLHGAELRGRSSAELARELGDGFASAVAKLPGGSWQGPIESSFGVHLVRIEERIEPPASPDANTRARMRADLLEHERAQRRRREIDRLVGRYDVHLPEAPSR